MRCRWPSDASVSQVGGVNTLPGATLAAIQSRARYVSGWLVQPQTAGASSTRRSAAGGWSEAKASIATAPPRLSPATAIIACGHRWRARATTVRRSSIISASGAQTPRCGERPKPRWS